MTTIVPDTSNEEGKKLAAYQPGESIALEVNVMENAGGKLGVEVTKCEPLEQEEADESQGTEGSDQGDQGEYPGGSPMGKSGMMKKGMPNAVVIAVGSRK